MNVNKEAEKKLLGREFHQVVLERVFGEGMLDYWHFKVVKVFEKSCRVKDIVEVSTGHCGNMPIERLLEPKKNYFYDSLQEGLDDHKKLLDDIIAKWTKDMDGYTDKHPEYKRYLFEIDLMKRYRALLDDYSVEKHKEIQRQNWEGYKALGAGRHRH